MQRLRLPIVRATETQDAQLRNFASGLEEEYFILIRDDLAMAGGQAEPDLGYRNATLMKIVKPILSSEMRHFSSKEI